MGTIHFRCLKYTRHYYLPIRLSDQMQICKVYCIIPTRYKPYSKWLEMITMIRSITRLHTICHTTIRIALTLANKCKKRRRIETNCTFSMLTYQIWSCISTWALPFVDGYLDHPIGISLHLHNYIDKKINHICNHGELWTAMKKMLENADHNVFVKFYSLWL
jgi:hypothetical protein